MNVQQWGYDLKDEERLAQYQFAAEYWTSIWEIGIFTHLKLWLASAGENSTLSERLVQN